MFLQLLITVGLCLPCLVYVTLKTRKFRVVRLLSEKSRAAGIAVSFLPAAGFIVYMFFRPINSAAMLLHLTAIWVLCSLVGFIAGKIAKKKPPVYVSGITAVTLSLVLIVWGSVLASDTRKTEYTVYSGKISEPLRIAQISDVHLGAVFDSGGLKTRLDEIEEEKPDILVVTGDFIDSYTDVDDVEAACRALGECKTRYGVFFIFGNHDVGTRFGRSGLETKELSLMLERYGVTVLKDETFEIPGAVVVGRKDRSQRDRADIAALLSGYNDVLSVVLDHQPNDTKAESEAGADLVLSGHTHGGQFFPLGFVGIYIGANELLYGLESIGDTTFIVTSGIADWATTFRTGCYSEYVIIDVLPE